MLISAFFLKQIRMFLHDKGLKTIVHFPECCEIYPIGIFFYCCNALLCFVTHWIISANLLSKRRNIVLYLFLF